MDSTNIKYLWKICIVFALIAIVTEFLRNLVVAEISGALCFITGAAALGCENAFESRSGRRKP